MGRKRPPLSKCRSCGRVLTATGYCSKCDANKSRVSDPGIFEVSFLSPPQDDEPFINFPDERTCHSCHRFSTQVFPLQFETVEGTSIVNRQKFGLGKTSSNITLCQLCSAFLKPSNPSYNKIAAFKCAWPAVFWKKTYGREYHLQLLAMYSFFVEIELAEQNSMWKFGFLE